MNSVAGVELGDVGVMSRQHAEETLLEQEHREPTAGDFLVRQSTSHPHHVLSVLIDTASHAFQHHVVEPTDGGAFTLNGSPLKAVCTNLSEVIAHLKANIDILPITIGSPVSVAVRDIQR
jgi:hypothetical protein